jgi:hypothetical protein
MLIMWWLFELGAGEAVAAFNSRRKRSTSHSYTCVTEFRLRPITVSMTVEMTLRALCRQTGTAFVPATDEPNLAMGNSGGLCEC